MSESPVPSNFVEKSAALHQPPVRDLIQWLVRELSQILDISPEAVVADEPFSHFGLGSIQAVALLNRLSEFLGRKIPVALAWKYPTIETLANYLCGRPDASSRGSVAHSMAATAWNQPIAVVGMACRFPGAPDPAAFWDLLRSGSSAIREISPDRWDIHTWYDPDLDKPGKMNARMAGLLERVDNFDPGFFGISPRETIQMDPQQRLALELTWEALEDAGIRPDALRGSRTGMFVGVVWHDYETIARKAGAEITVHSGTGQALSIVANRISYALGLQGPSIALDTACSSSLVSVHLACRSLQAGDATLALAGGVNMIIDPETMVALSKFGGLSPTSQLCAFDARANGFVRGEGGGFVVLKSLDKALADGDPIYAVIRGTAVNNDGASNGLTAPNPAAQESVLRQACARSGLQAADLHYVEAHGTGTPLGDPIEAHALGEVFGRERASDRPLLVGSVKTNIGHLEGASGIAGLIKLILSIHHRQIPPSLNFEKPNPHIDFAASNLRVVTKLVPWPEPKRLAVGGASAFGWGGTNCHVVVEEASSRTAHLLPLSAPNSSLLKATAEKLQTYLQSGSFEATLPDLCATAAARCATESERVALTARSLSELSVQLQGFLLGQKRPGLAVGYAGSTRPKLAFVFSPQGSQWLGMGKNLMAVEPVFRAKLAECDHSLKQIAGWSLFDLLLAAPGDVRLSRAEFVQPVLSAMQIALAALWGSWGVRPDFVAAHSLGEWAAACVAGALNVDEVMRVVVESSRAQMETGENGGMAVVELAEAEVRERIQRWSDEIFVAGSNSQTSTILSGDAGRLKEIITSWKDEGLQCSLIDVDIAAHSPRMDLAIDRLEASLRDLHPLRTAVPFASSVNGDYLLGPEMGPEHWARHLRQPVLFTQVIERLARDGCTLFLEVSPHPLLNGAIQQILSASGAQGVVLGSCRRADDERGSLLNSLGTLYTLGWPVQWAAISSGGKDGLSLPIAEGPSQQIEPVASPEETLLLLPLSCHTPEALRDRARTLAYFLRTRKEIPTSDIAYTLAARREHLEHRLAVVGVQREELPSILHAFADGRTPLQIAAGQTRSGTRPRVAFVLSGQGSQWWGMGRELLSSLPIFQREIARCADEMKRHIAWDLLEELRRDEATSRLDETEIAQPALFALQVALATVWRSWGIEPDALIGHSVGEVAAAHLSGALSFDDAIKVICHRGRLMQRATGLGKMAAIELPEAEIEKWLRPYRDLVSPAAINSPTSTVISGDSAAIDQIMAAAKNRGIRAKILPVNYAFHSPQMELLGNEMVEAVSGLITRTASIPVYSTVTGAQGTDQDFDAAYWGRNIRQTVLFAAAVRPMLDSGFNTFVELSPDPVLSSMVLQAAAGLPESLLILPSLRRGQSDRLQMLKSLTSLFVAGAEINWQGVYPAGGRVVPLPVYPWQRKRFWLDQGAGFAEAQSELAETPADWFYEVNWEEKSRADDVSIRAVTRRLSSPYALQARVETRIARVQTETHFVHSLGAHEDIERLAGHYAAEALVRLGLEHSSFRRFTASSVRALLGVQTRHSRLLSRMLEMLAEDGLLLQVGAYFETTPAFQAFALSLSSLADQREALHRKHTNFATEFDLLAKCGEQLAGVLRGEVDPLQLLFATDDSVNAERLYRDSTSARFYNRLIAELVGEAAQEASSGSTVRLLELGAGTGSTTTSILERLSGVRTTYCFTDISRMLLNEARSRFVRFPNVSYQMLDIEKPLGDQELNLGGHDIVVAANVLHATVDLRAALRHVRQLLAPGGLLILLETTAPRRWLDLIFGLTQGWGRFADTELRPKNALLNSERWLALLNDSGFRASAAIGAEVSAGDPHEQAVLVAQANEPSAEKMPPESEKPVFSATGQWLVFSDTGGFTEAVARQLEQHGGQCVRVTAGNHFDASDPRQVTIDVNKPEDYRNLLKNETLWKGVLHGWTLDAVLDQASALPDLDHAEHLSCRSALFLVQALALLERPQPLKIWLLTRGAQSAWSQAKLDSIAQAPIWGLGRTLALEHPQFWGGLIDLAPEGDSQLLAQRIAHEICLPDGEDQIALSDDRRFVPRLLSTQPPKSTPMAIRQSALYLITGGLGGLGLHIARRLVRNGARHLILCGRRALPERSTWEELSPSDPAYEQMTAIRHLERQGATVHLEKVDVADRGQMEALFERVRLSSVPLSGIIHAAADIQFCPLQGMSADALHATMRAKVQGSWLLHELSGGMALDFFVLFSSTTTLFGGSRMGHYAAANQFLDSFAHWRRIAGLPALSINWGAWDEMRALGDQRDEVGRFGLKGMPVHLALQALSFLTSEGAAQKMVADVDWELLKPALEARGRRPFFEHISAKLTSQKADGMASDWIKHLEIMAPEERRELILSLVAGETRSVLGLVAGERVDPDRGLFELGMDSLMSVQLKGYLEKSIGGTLPSTLTFTYPTVNALTDFLLVHVLKLSTTTSVDVPSANENKEAQLLDESLEALTEEEIKTMLGAELSSLAWDLRD